MKKVIFGVIGLTFLAKIFGFFREILLSYYFGASGISDAYLISQTIPGTIFQFVGTGLTTCFIPVFLKVQLQKGKKEADRLTNSVISVVLFFSTAVIVLVWLFTKPIVSVFAAGFEGQTLSYAILFTRISILSLYLSTIIYVFTSYLQSQNSFWIVAFAAIPNSIVVMLSIVMAAKVNIVILSIGSVCAIAIQLAVMWPSVWRLGLRLKYCFDWKSGYIPEIFRLMGPVIVGVSVNQMNVLIDRTVASTLSAGGISALIYADSLIMFVQGAFSQTIATVYYPSLTRLAEDNDLEGLKSYINQAISVLVLLLCPITVGTMLLAPDIISILYGRGAFDTTALQMTSTALFCYAFGILGGGIREILSRVFYSFHDTKTPMKNATFGMVLNIVLNLLLSRVFGIGGLALATSISASFIAILLWCKLKQKIGRIASKEYTIQLFKIVVSSGLMGMAVFFVKRLLANNISQYLLFVICVLVGVLFFGVAAVLLRVNAVQEVMKVMGLRKKETYEINSK